MLLLLKLVVAPALVGTVTLAVRRWGPAIGGWLSGMPVVAGPVLVFLVVEQGVVFGTQAAHATLAGLIGTVAFTVAYARTSVRMSWYGCLLVGWIAFAAVAVVLYAAPPPLAVSLIGLIAATAIGRCMLPETSTPSSAQASPRGDLILRLVATAALVLALTAVADQLGPRLSGLLNAFPVLTTIIAAFTHAQRGSATTVAFVRSFLRAIIGFGLFCFVLALTLTRAPLGVALMAALAAQVMVSTLTLRYTYDPYRPAASLQLSQSSSRSMSQ
jgi:hypothetical protein